MAKFEIIYHGELDTGDLSAYALAQYLSDPKQGENSDFNVWEVFQSGNIGLASVAVLETKTKEK